MRIAAIMALALCGCGGAKAAAHPTPTPRSAALQEFAQRANAVCDRHWPALSRIAPRIARAESLRDTAYDDLATGMQRMFDDLRVIPKPPGDRRPPRLIAAYGDIVTDLRFAVDDSRGDAGDVGEQYAREAIAAAAKAQRIASSIGVTRCTTGLADRKGG
jgi:hypothetical protein